MSPVIANHGLGSLPQSGRQFLAIISHRCQAPDQLLKVGLDKLLLDKGNQRSIQVKQNCIQHKYSPCGCRFLHSIPKKGCFDKAHCPAPGKGRLSRHKIRPGTPRRSRSALWLIHYYCARYPTTGARPLWVMACHFRVSLKREITCRGSQEAINTGNSRIVRVIP